MPFSHESPGFHEIPVSDGGLFTAGQDGVQRILTPLDEKTEFIIYQDKTLVLVKSALGYPAIYPLPQADYIGPAKAVLMDLDGTSVKSETFWIWIIEQTVAALLKNSRFSLEEADLPFVSGHSVSEHLQYCLDKYCPNASLVDARRIYTAITRQEMQAIMTGKGEKDAFVPAEGLKDFLLTLKARGIRIGLVTSGLYEKAMPEIVSAFRTLGMGDPLEFYDAIITAGTSFSSDKGGTLGELEPKPHPWLYAETAAVGLGLTQKEKCRVIGIEDAGAGVLALRLAGFAVAGMEDGNITASGLDSLCCAKAQRLDNLLPLLVGEG